VLICVLMCTCCTLADDAHTHTHTHARTFEFNFQCTSATCADESACTYDYCDALTGCVHKPIVCDGVCLTQREIGSSKNGPHTYTHDYDFVLLLEHPHTHAQAQFILHNLKPFVTHTLSPSLPNPHTHTYVNARFAVARYNFPPYIHTHDRLGIDMTDTDTDTDTVEILSPFSHSLPLTLAAIEDALFITHVHTNTHSSPSYTLNAISSFLNLTSAEMPGTHTHTTHARKHISRLFLTYYPSHAHIHMHTYTHHRMLPVPCKCS